MCERARNWLAHTHITERCDMLWMCNVEITEELHAYERITTLESMDFSSSNGAWARNAAIVLFYMVVDALMETRVDRDLIRLYPPDGLFHEQLHGEYTAYDEWKGRSYTVSVRGHAIATAVAPNRTLDSVLVGKAA